MDFESTVSELCVNGKCEMLYSMLHSTVYFRSQPIRLAMDMEICCMSISDFELFCSSKYSDNTCVTLVKAFC